MLHRNQNSDEFRADLDQEVCRTDRLTRRDHALKDASTAASIAAKSQSRKINHGKINPEDCEGTHFISGR